MRSNPAAQMHAQRAKFFLRPGGLRIQPNAVVAFPPFRTEPKLGRGANPHFFKLLNIPANVAYVLGQIQNRVAYNLSWTMIRDIAATVAKMEFYVHLGQ